MAEFFRFRSRDALLGKYQELEKQTIYFAYPEDLNDPMEGFRDIVWKGDKIAWTNFFKHYTLCLHRFFSMFRVIGGSKELNIRNIPILYSQDELLTPQEKDLFNSIWQKFFNVSKIKEIIETIADMRRKIRYREIIYYLQIIHFILLETIRKLHITRGLMSESEMPQLSEELIAESVEGILKTIELTEAIENDQQLDIIWEMQTIFDYNSRLVQQYDRRKIFNGISNEILKKNNQLVIFDFPKVYVENLKNLPFNKWWTACFTKSCDNLSVWGNYADGHRGACMIFEGNINWKSTKFWITEFRKVSYENKPIEIDFFRSIGAGTDAEIRKTWYTDEDGNRSECASHVGDESEDTWRRDYWDNFFRIITTKNRDWKYEQEYRVILYDNIRGIVEKDDHTLTYDFNSLKGIIFGMRTSTEDKLKIIDIIKSKCAENNRTDFKFFQAYYSPENGDIRKHEIQMPFSDNR